MKRPLKWEWQHDFDLVSAISKSMNGEVVKATDAYVAFRYIDKSITPFRLVFYPYKSSRWNYVLRVRVEGGKNKKQAEFAVDYINEQMDQLKSNYDKRRFFIKNDNRTPEARTSRV